MNSASPPDLRQIFWSGFAPKCLMAWAGIATLNGLPATTMPNGRSESGLPIGVQIIGGYLEDRSTIAFAGLIEREFGGFTPPPI
jgi:amidase